MAAATVLLVGSALTPVAAHATQVSSGSTCDQDVVPGNTGVVTGSSGCDQVIGDLTEIELLEASDFPVTPTLTASGNTGNVGVMTGGTGSQQFVGGGGGNTLADTGSGSLQGVFGFDGTDANGNTLVDTGSGNIQFVTNLQPNSFGVFFVSNYPFSATGCGTACTHASSNHLVASGTGIQQTVNNGSGDTLIGSGSNIIEAPINASDSSILVRNPSTSLDAVLLEGTPSAPLTGDTVDVLGTGDIVLVTESDLTIIIPADDDGITCVNTACP